MVRNVQILNKILISTIPKITGNIRRLNNVIHHAQLKLIKPRNLTLKQ
jgi:hypothetical protein